MGAKPGAAHFWSRAVAALVVGVWALLTRVPLAELGARFLLSTLALLLCLDPSRSGGGGRVC
jgi:hypothetical protein